jgi:hypothetical protein
MKRVSKKEQDRIDLDWRCRCAALGAYDDQERKTCDPVVKKAVMEAVTYMWDHIMGREPKPTPITIGHIDLAEARAQCDRQGEMFKEGLRSAGLVQDVLRADLAKLREGAQRALDRHDWVELRTLLHTEREPDQTPTLCSACDSLYIGKDHRCDWSPKP